MATEIKKGYDSLYEAYRNSCGNWPAQSESYKKKFEWVLNRAQQYADKLGVDREVILQKWEERRDYWFMNFYQESNQPDLDNNAVPVVTLAQWREQGEALFGDDMMGWKFKCPQCGHVSSLGEFKKAGLDPNLATSCCASRFKELSYRKDDCKWTTGGLFRVGGMYVLSESYVPVLVFDFAR